MEHLVRLATILVHDAAIVSLAGQRLDGACRDEILELVDACIDEGASSIVLDLAPTMALDPTGARVIAEAARRIGGGRRLVLSGLNARARATLCAHRVTEAVELVGWWGEAVEPEARAA